MKIGRNQPCPCGSGKKYKKCCIDKQIPLVTPVAMDSLPQEVLSNFKEQMEKTKKEEELLKSIGIYIPFVKPANFKGGKVWGIGSAIYHSRPLTETFHEFIVDMLRLHLGKDWWDSQDTLPWDKKHFIMQCFQKFREWWEIRTTQKYKIGENLWAALPDGWSRSLVSIAFDVVSLIHAQELPAQLVERLKDMNAFQGARYELAIAAIFARLGFDIRFLDKEDIAIKHCEFIATHTKMGIQVAVEAKSKHKQGVLHYPGESNEYKQLKGKVMQLFHQALEKEVGEIPFIIFIDVNAPLTPSIPIEEKPWVKDILKARKNELTKTPDSTPKYNAVYFTNFSYHYQKEDITTAGEFISELPQSPQYPFPNTELINMLQAALNNYGNVPNLDTEVVI